MAQRHRGRSVRYGGWQCGMGPLSSTTPAFEPSFNGAHFCDDETHPGPPYRSGGPFLVKKSKCFIKRFTPFSSHYFNGLGWYDGYMGVIPYVPPVEPSPLSLSGWGAKGWNRTYPTHPIYQLGVSLLELKDLPGMLSQTRNFYRSFNRIDVKFSKTKVTVGEFLQDLKKGPAFIGDHYLNVAFGWVPFIQDLVFLSKMKDKLAKKMAWLKRHNGKSIRRKVDLDKGEFSENIPRTIASLATCFPTQSSNNYAAGMAIPRDYPIIKTYNRKIWFSAKYRFYIPELANDQYFKKDHSHLEAELLGLDLDPTTLYKVYPWTWLLDWFTSTGSVVQNIFMLQKHHVVAEYAYVMCRENYTYQAPGYVEMQTGKQVAFVWVGPIKKMTGVSRTIYEFRAREVANPFGFGLTFASLSAYQWSILAALGLTRRNKNYAPRA